MFGVHKTNRHRKNNIYDVVLMHDEFGVYLKVYLRYSEHNEEVLYVAVVQQTD